MAKKRSFDLDAYPFVVRRLTGDEGGGYLVEYTDVPHCIADGKTADEAIRNGREALEACLVTIAESGHPIPAPESKGSSGQWRQRVPKSLHARLVDRAEREGVSLNALVMALIAEGMGRRASRDR
jgi:antitoxin HicB